MKLLEHFKELSLHPKNSEELKGLILQLAVQGKLTANWREKNTDVEPASGLLNRIEESKNRLIEQKIFKAKYDTDKFEPLINRPEIPNSWIYVTVGNICELITGATPSKSQPQYFGGNIKWLVSGDIHKGYIHDCEGRITDEGMSSSNCKVLPIDSVMIALNGQGKTRATVALLKTEATCNQSLVAMKPFMDNSALSEYIYYLLKGKYFQIREITGQKERRGLNMTLVSQLPIALPPLEEQKAIVEVVKTLFAEVEELESLNKERLQLKESFVVSALNKLTEAKNTQQEWNFLQQHFSSFFTEKKNIKSLRETILQLAVRGKLTEVWRANNLNTEPASELLKRIQAEKQQLIAEKKIKKEKSLPQIKEDEMPYELPEGWAWCRFQEIFDIRDGTHDSPKDSLDKVTYPLVTSKNFNNGEIDFDSARRISEEDYLKVIQRSKVHKGDILFSMIGGNIGNQVEVGDFTEYAIKNIALFKHYKYGLPEEGFLKVFSKYIAMSLQSEASGGAQPFVSLKFFRSLILGLPSAEEQKIIVEKVNSLMALCDELEQQIETSNIQIEQLMQSCVAEALA